MYLFPGSPNAEASDDDDWEEMPKIKEVAEGPYYDQFDYNVTRNYTVIAGTPAEVLCRIKLKPSDGNKTVRCSFYFFQCSDLNDKRCMNKTWKKKRGEKRNRSNRSALPGEITSQLAILL